MKPSSALQQPSRLSTAREAKRQGGQESCVSCWLFDRAAATTFKQANDSLGLPQCKSDDESATVASLQFRRATWGQSCQSLSPSIFEQRDDLRIFGVMNGRFSVPAAKCMRRRPGLLHSISHKKHISALFHTQGHFMSKTNSITVMLMLLIVISCVQIAHVYHLDV